MAGQGDKPLALCASPAPLLLGIPEKTKVAAQGSSLLERKFFLLFLIREDSGAFDRLVENRTKSAFCNPRKRLPLSLPSGGDTISV